MQALRKLLPEQKATKKFVARCDDQLFRIRDRDSQTQRKKHTTVELIVAESAGTLPPSRIAAETIIGVRAGLREEERAQCQMAARTGGNERWLRLWPEQQGQCVVCDQQSPATASGWEKRCAVKPGAAARELPSASPSTRLATCETASRDRDVIKGLSHVR